MENELTLLNTILNYEIKEIMPETRFWMIRTEKGYFYNEFTGKNFVALAWNSITKTTNFSEQTREALCDSITLDYPDTKRPATAVNKCKIFIEEVKVNDIIVIPNAGSTHVTFALAGEYFEDLTKTLELEKKIINRIEQKDVVIDEVSCPYRKRRKITILRTVKSEDINYSLYRAISNYHGISNLDNYSRYILNMIYNVYSHNNNLNIIFNVKKEGPIGPRNLSKILYGVTEYICGLNIDENKISTQVNINSPGPIDFLVTGVFNTLKDNYIPLIGLLVAVGGGSFLTFKLPGIPQMIKDILTIPEDVKQAKLATKIKQKEDGKMEIELWERRIELYNKIKSSGINPEDLDRPLEALIQCAAALDIQPIGNSEIIIAPIVTDPDDDPDVE